MEERKEINIEKKGNEEIHRHPAFGIIGFYQSHGGEKELFGSSISHNNTVILELRHAYSERGLSNDYHYGRGLITRVEMSYSQFAELISIRIMGMGFLVLSVLRKKMEVFQLSLPIFPKGSSSKMNSVNTFRMPWNKYRRKLIGSKSLLLRKNLSG